MDRERIGKRKESVEDINPNPSPKRVCVESLEELSAAYTLLCFKLVETPKVKDNCDENVDEELVWKIPPSEFEADEDQMNDKEVVVASPSKIGGRKKPFSLALHFLCALRNAMFALWHSVDIGALNIQQGAQSTTDQRSPSFSLDDILEKLTSLHHGDRLILGSANEPLQLPLETLTRGALLALSFSPPDQIQGSWGPLTSQYVPTGYWSWLGSIIKFSDPTNLRKVHLSWGITRRVFNHYVKSFRDWVDIEKRHVAALAALEGLEVAPALEVTTRFREEERIRYTIPERAFYYTAMDGVKSTVPPLFNSKKMIPRKWGSRLLRADRPRGVTVCSVVNDAVARLPDGEGTTRDICFLVRDSQYLMLGIDDIGIWKMVSNALHSLQWDEEPSVVFVKVDGVDGVRRVWRYLHRMRSVDDF